jgi:uncharacterized protein YndB with AHSA1/START domain
VRVELTIEISRPPQEVFDYLADLSKLPEWQASAVESRADGPLAQGTRISERRSFMGRDVDTEVEVAEYDPPRRLTLRALEAPVKLTIEHVLEEHDGGTRLRVTAEGKPTGALWLAGPAAELGARRELNRDFERLKELLEE